MSKFFISRPVFACVISIVIVILGAVAGFRLPIAQYPELAPPIVRVEALYPGANAQTVADTVATALEQEINGVDNMIYMNSTSADGRYSLDISFQVGTDVDLAAVLVQNRVSIAEPRLPEEVRRLGVTTRKQSTALAGVIALHSPTGESNDIVLSNFLSLYWRDEIARVPGVGGITIVPAKDYGMRIWTDPLRLKARGLTSGDVAQAIRAQNVQVAAGAIGRQPAPAGTDFELIITTLGRLSTPEQFADIIVKSDDQGRIVRVGDVARVELGARDYSTLAGFNGKPNAILVVYQLPGANLVQVTSAIEAKLTELTGPQAVPLPPGAKAEFFYDSSMFIRASLAEVLQTLAEAFVLVFAVVLIFLQNLRATLIPTLTIPVSLIGTLLFLTAFGFSINMLTMFGMVLAIGIVVDDAIVVVENVERNMTVHKLSPFDATVRAMSEITGPVVAVTLVLMSVFLPTAALPGITGEMYRQFALTIAASTFLSAVCALTLAPALCAVLLRPHDPRHKPFVLLRPISFAAGLFNRVFDAITRLYGSIARWGARLAVVSILLFAGVMYGTATLIQRIPAGFVPNEDLGFIVVAAQLPDGASLERSKAVIDRVSDMLKPSDGSPGVPGIANIVSLTGFSVLQGQSANVANAWIVLEDWDKRYSNGETLDRILAEINAKVAGIQEAQFLVFSLPPISGLGNTSGFDMRLQDRAGIGRSSMEATAWELINTAIGQSRVDGGQRISAAFTSFRAGVPQLYLEIDREKIIKLGIPIQSVFETLQSSLGSAYVNDFNLLGRTFQVNLQADANFRLVPDDIRKLEVRNNRGEMVPLGTLLTIRDTIGPDRIERYNMYPAAMINGFWAPGTSSGEAMSIMEQAAKSLPQGVTYEWSSLSYQEKQAGGQAAVVFLLGILLVYLILAAQYESWATPLAVVLSVPLVLIGALLFVQYRGLDNNLFTQIGLVLLIGLGAKNAILIVEFARENRAKGMSIIDSAIDAATTRFRPILMTSFSFILGVLPLTLATGAGAGSRQALGIAVFGGMLGQTILGLFFTPMFYVVVQTIAEWVKPPRPKAPAPKAQAETAPQSAPAAAPAGGLAAEAAGCGRSGRASAEG